MQLFQRRLVFVFSDETSVEIGKSYPIADNTPYTFRIIKIKEGFIVCLYDKNHRLVGNSAVPDNQIATIRIIESGIVCERHDTLALEYAFTRIGQHPEIHTTRSGLFTTSHFLPFATYCMTDGTAILRREGGDWMYPWGTSRAEWYVVTNATYAFVVSKVSWSVLALYVRDGADVSQVVARIQALYE